ncbi:Lipid A export ATP-binding/permease protein MsbA [compost metagenome]
MKSGLSKTIDNNIFMLKLIWKASPARIALNLLFSIVNRLMTFLFFVLLLRYILNGFSNGVEFTKVLIIVVVVGLLKIIFSMFESYFLQIYVPISDQNIRRYIQNILIKKAKEVDIECYEDPKYYDRYVKALSEVNTRAKAVIDSISNFVGIIVYISLASYVIFTIDPIFFCFILIPIVASLIIGKMNNKIYHKYNMIKLEIEREKDYTRRTFYLKEYSKEVRITNINKVLFRRFQESVESLVYVTKKYGMKLSFTQYLFFLSNEVLTDGLIFFYASYKVLVNKSLLLGDFFVVIDVTGDIAWSTRELIDVYLEFEAHSLYIDNLRVFLEYTPKIDSNPNGKIADAFTSHLKLEDVSFQYESANQPVLKNINLEVKNGQKIAIVGNNGAGKSSLVKLIMRLYDTSEGSIYYNGENVKHYSLESYRNVYKSVFQNYKLFSYTVAENVLMHQVSTEEQYKLAEESLKAVGSYEKISKLKYGMDTVISREFDEEGVELSGGEAQKIAISRIFAQESGIIILDEPSSALDPIAEFNLFEDIFKICESKTVIFISHRMFSAMMADYIYLLRDGVIVEQGTHKELMANNGEYADMFNKQAENYLENEVVK